MCKRNSFNVSRSLLLQNIRAWSQESLSVCDFSYRGKRASSLPSCVVCYQRHTSFSIHPEYWVMNWTTRRWCVARRIAAIAQNGTYQRYTHGIHQEVCPWNAEDSLPMDPPTNLCFLPTHPLILGPSLLCTPWSGKSKHLRQLLAHAESQPTLQGLGERSTLELLTLP